MVFLEEKYYKEERIDKYFFKFDIFFFFLNIKIGYIIFKE